MTPQEHNRLISILFHVQGGLQVLTGLLIVLIFAGSGGFFLAVGGEQQHQIVGGLFVVVALATAFFVFAFAALDFFAAFKMAKVQPIGRTLGIVVAFLSVLSFPLGTALGAYALWFFFGDPGKSLYENGASGPRQSPPPPPNSWQH